MLNKCEVDTNCDSTTEKNHILQKMVDKYMFRGKKNPEIKRYNL